MSQQENSIINKPNNTNNEKNNKPNIISSNLSNIKCHQCSSEIILRATNDNKNVSIQCAYINCKIRSKNLFECAQCSDMWWCRNCNMSLCKLCRSSLKVLKCHYCSSFICSQQCYAQLLKKYFNYLENFGISANAHKSVHFFRKLLFAPNLHSALSNVNESHTPFHVCESCKIQTCGCINWLSCCNCRKYYCIDCEDKALKKCTLEECQSRTCCRKKQWDTKCEYCNRLKNCGLVFCTKGHCNRHIIVSREIQYNEQKIDDKNNDNINDIDNDINDNDDIDLTQQQ